VDRGDGDPKGACLLPIDIDPEFRDIIHPVGAHAGQAWVLGSHVQKSVRASIRAAWPTLPISSSSKSTPCATPNSGMAGGGKKISGPSSTRQRPSWPGQRLPGREGRHGSLNASLSSGCTPCRYSVHGRKPRADDVHARLYGLLLRFLKVTLNFRGHLLCLLQGGARRQDHLGKEVFPGPRQGCNSWACA